MYLTWLILLPLMAFLLTALACTLPGKPLATLQSLARFPACRVPAALLACLVQVTEAREVLPSAGYAGYLLSILPARGVSSCLQNSLGKPVDASFSGSFSLSSTFSAVCGQQTLASGVARLVPFWRSAVSLWQYDWLKARELLLTEYNRISCLFQRTSASFWLKLLAYLVEPVCIGLGTSGTCFSAGQKTAESQDKSVAKVSARFRSSFR